MKSFYSYFDVKTVFTNISWLCIFFFLGGVGGGGGGSGGQITSSFTCGQRYSMHPILLEPVPAILCTSHLYPLPPPPTSIGGDNDFSKPCPVPVGTS